MIRNDFNSIYSRLVDLYSEDMVAGAGGVFGDTGSMGFGGDVPGGKDFYAPGDARSVTNQGTFTRRGKIKTKKKKSKIKKTF